MENRILRKVFKNPQLSVEKSSSADRSIVEMTFAVKTEPNDEEMESNSLQQTTSDLQHSAVTLEDYTLDYFINSSALPQASQVSVSSEVRLFFITFLFHVFFFFLIGGLVVFKMALARFKHGGRGGGGREQLLPQFPDLSN